MKMVAGLAGSWSLVRTGDFCWSGVCLWRKNEGIGEERWGWIGLSRLSGFFIFDFLGFIMKKFGLADWGIFSLLVLLFWGLGGFSLEFYLNFIWGGKERRREGVALGIFSIGVKEMLVIWLEQVWSLNGLGSWFYLDLKSGEDCILMI